MSYPGTTVVDEDSYANSGPSCSGMYDTEKQSNDYRLELKIDVDSPNAFQRSLNFVSGTVKVKAKKMWSGRATAGYFRSRTGGVEVRHDNDLIIVNSPIYATLSDGGSREGHVSVTCKSSREKWYCDVNIQIENATAVFNNVVRQSTHYREVTIDIDYVTEAYLPKINLQSYKDLPKSYGGRELTIFAVFKDAGLKLTYEATNSEKVADPTEDTSWTKGDMFSLMEDFFNDVDDEIDQNIWCLMADSPPDSRYMGYSFEHDEKRGFGLFTHHTSFVGINDKDPKVKAEASRRFLHYMAHECGHTLGLVHPFEEDRPDSLTWMNYAYKYNIRNGEGAFYKDFRYSFSDHELTILRHQPDNLFKRTYKKESGVPYQYSVGPKSLGPSGDDSDDEDDYQQGAPPRKLKFEIKVRPQPYSKGDIVEFEATLTNVGKLPCKIEPGFVPGGGSFNVFVTNPVGDIKIVKPFAIGIDAPTRKYLVLGHADSAVNPSSYSEVVPLIQNSNGGLFEKIGTYQIDATYEAAGMRATCETVDVVIEEDNNDDDDDVTKDYVRISAELDGDVGEVRAKKVLEYWRKQVKKPAEVKAKRIQALLRLLRGLSKSSLKLIAGGKSARKRRRRLGKKVTRVPGHISAEQLCIDTADLVDYFHSNYGNRPAENQCYCDLVLERTKLMKQNNLGQAQIEYNQLLADLIDRNVKYEVVKDVASKWKEIAFPKIQTTAEELQGYQDRVRDIIYWRPKEEIERGGYEQSGLGLRNPFNFFDMNQRNKVEQFVTELDNVERDTDDLDAVLNFAEAKQRSYEVNESLYQFTFERYIVRSKLAKKLHVTYPDPLKMNPDYLSNAAIMTTVREKNPEEVWMNYWRCNGEFNHHHKHWHAVYGGGPHLETLIHRQGELFWYMHSQLLARYDAERESWGLKPVQPWEYNEADPLGFDAGLEFHDAYPNYRPRPIDHKWEPKDQIEIAQSEKAIVKAFKNKELSDGTELDTNLAGNIVESSSGRYLNDYGSMHNMGHMAFVAFTNRNGTSYMGSTESAVRDPIFFRWHKRVDNLLVSWNNKETTELGKDAPGVIVEPSDVIIRVGGRDVDGFKDWNGSNWDKRNFKSDTIKTFMEPLNEHAFEFEWDNQLTHDKFAYHIRVRRKADKKGEIAMTIRLFICQERHINNRRRWIEMDKFVHKMGANEDRIVVEREDIEASVIKRIHDSTKNSAERKFVTEVQGNCECGWPYKMMLPRGERDGEKWVLSCMISDNKLDDLGTTTGCGSMSYCGTLDQIYPDKRVMGYPFTTPITVQGKPASISQAEQMLTNFTFSKFEIVCNYPYQQKPQKPKPLPRPPPPTSPTRPGVPPRPGPTLPEPSQIWSPLAEIRGHNIDHVYSDSSSWRLKNTVMRVVLDDKDFNHPGSGRIRISFRARTDGYPYSLRNVKLSLRVANSLNVDARYDVDVLFNGQPNVEVDLGKGGRSTVSDEIVLKRKLGDGVDYFVTFRLEGSGTYLYSSDRKQNTYVVQHHRADEAIANPNWAAPRRQSFLSRRMRSVYCVDQWRLVP